MQNLQKFHESIRQSMIDLTIIRERTSKDGIVGLIDDILMKLIDDLVYVVRRINEINAPHTPR